MSMTFDSCLVVAVALLSLRAWQFAVTGYLKMPAALYPYEDILGARHHAQRERNRQRFGSTWTLPALATLALLVVTPGRGWEVVDPHGVLRPLVLVATGVMTWRAITMDVELASGAWHPGCRALMALAWLGVWVHPGFVVLVLHTGFTWLRSNYHHQHLAIRTLLVFLAALGVLPFVGAIDPTPPILFLVLVVCASQYFVPGIGKSRLGPRWYSWMLDNRLHTIAIAAYLWGWLRFLPEAPVIRVVRWVARLDRPFQILTWAIEVGAVAILVDPRLAVALLVAFTGFHAMVATLSGILFWQFVAVDLALAWAVWSLPPEAADATFGLAQGLVAAALLVALPLRKRLWAPFDLAWWDTAFACRVQYEVVGASGERYGLHADFMCPNERIFGQNYGAFLSDEKRVTWHIGETSRRAQFDAVTAAGEDLSLLADAKEALGKSRYDAELEAIHDRYITDFLRAHNRGDRKRVVPGWLKAPGGQLFYWGELPRFRGQEPVDELLVHYREDYFDGERVVRVTDRLLKRFGPEALGRAPLQ